MVLKFLTQIVDGKKMGEKKPNNKNKMIFTWPFVVKTKLRIPNFWENSSLWSDVSLAIPGVQEVHFSM